MPYKNINIRRQKQREYARRPEVIAKKKKYMKEFLKDYLKKPEVINARREAQQRHNKTEKRKESHRRFERKYKRWLDPKRKDYQNNYHKQFYAKYHLSEVQKKADKKHRYSPQRKQYLKEYFSIEENKRRRLEVQRNYYKHNGNKYQRERKKLDIQFAITCRIRSTVNSAIRKYIQKGWMPKKGEIDYAGIIEKLKPFPEELEKYHIDHIIPLSSFDLIDPEQFKKATAPENHQWLLKEENLRKGAKIPLPVNL